MIKQFHLLFLLLFPVSVFAVDFHVVNLYDQTARIPGTLIPFKVTGDKMDTGKLRKILVDPVSAEHCKAMIDPFLKNIFLLKCKKATPVLLRILITRGEQSYEVNYGPIEVKNPFSGTVIVKPDPLTDPNVLIGRQLFMAHCKACHEPTLKANRTVQQIKTAVANITEMKVLAPVLSNTDFIKLEIYLKTVVRP